MGGNSSACGLFCFFDSCPQAVENVQRVIGELASIFQRVATMITHQEEMIQRIDQDLDTSMAHIREGATLALIRVGLVLLNFFQNPSFAFRARVQFIPQDKASCSTSTTEFPPTDPSSSRQDSFTGCPFSPQQNNGWHSIAALMRMVWGCMWSAGLLDADGLHSVFRFFPELGFLAFQRQHNCFFYSVATEIIVVPLTMLLYIVPSTLPMQNLESSNLCSTIGLSISFGAAVRGQSYSNNFLRRGFRLSTRTRTMFIRHLGGSSKSASNVLFISRGISDACAESVQYTSWRSHGMMEPFFPSVAPRGEQCTVLCFALHQDAAFT